MTIVGGEERARQILAESYRRGGMAGSADQIAAGNLTDHDRRVIRAMLTFAAEASGIGVLRETLRGSSTVRANDGLMIQFVSAERAGAAFDVIAGLAASISSREAE